jgi:hypothetical protein
MLMEPSSQGSTSSLAASPVRILALLVSKRVYQLSGRDYGLNFPESSAKLDPASLCWRTWQTSFMSAEQPLLPTLPTSGMTQFGQLYPLSSLDHLNRAAAGLPSLWITPSASDNKERQVGNYVKTRSGMIAKANQYRSAIRLSSHIIAVEQERLHSEIPQGHRINPAWLATLMGYPSDWLTTPFQQEVGYRQSLKNRPGLRRNLRAGLVKVRR